MMSLPSKKKNEEGFLEYLAQVVSGRLGPDVAHLWRASTETHDGVQLCLVDVEKADYPVFVKMDDDREVFVVRNGPRKEKLDGKAQHEYTKRRFEAPVRGWKSKRR